MSIRVRDIYIIPDKVEIQDIIPTLYNLRIEYLNKLKEEYKSMKPFFDKEPEEFAHWLLNSYYSVMIYFFKGKRLIHFFDTFGVDKFIKLYDLKEYFYQNSSDARHISMLLDGVKKPLSEWKEIAKDWKERAEFYHEFLDGGKKFKEAGLSYPIFDKSDIFLIKSMF